MEPRRLKSPPIREALIDLKTSFKVAPAADVFEKTRVRLSDQFPDTASLHEVRGQIRVQGPQGRVTSETRDAGFVGYILKSADGSRIAQFKREGFTYNQVGNYTSFDELSRQAQGIWHIFLEEFRPQSVTQVSLRYINEFSSFRDWRSILADFPRWGFECRPLRHESRTVLKDTRSQAKAVLRQAVNAMDAERASPVLIDIETTIDSLAEDPSMDRFWELLAPLRNFKNRLFFGSLSEDQLKEFDR